MIPGFEALLIEHGCQLMSNTICQSYNDDFLTACRSKYAAPPLFACRPQWTRNSGPDFGLVHDVKPTDSTDGLRYQPIFNHCSHLAVALPSYGRVSPPPLAKVGEDLIAYDQQR